MCLLPTRCTYLSFSFFIVHFLPYLLCFLNGPFPAPFTLFSSFLQTVNRKYWFNKSCWWLDSNGGPLVTEATALPTEPQPLPYHFMFVSGSSVLLSFLSRPTFINLLLLPLYFEVGTKMSSFDQSRSSNHENMNQKWCFQLVCTCVLGLRFEGAFRDCVFEGAFWGCVLGVRFEGAIRDCILRVRFCVLQTALMRFAH